MACDDPACRALFEAAEELLEACHDALRGTPKGTPAYYFVSPGTPALDNFYDTDQLSVHVGQPAAVLAATSPTAAPLDTGFRAQFYDQVNLISLTITVARCVPTVGDQGMPSADAQTVAAEQILCDLWSIWNHLRQRKHDGTLFAPLDRAFFQLPALALEPSGGAGGWIIPVQVQVDGYEPAAVPSC